ncbi:MAG: ribonuclease III [Lachnospiraceae bacterium]|nr:ribonuclease III [Lachnospiraceae bacterium]
MEDFKSLVEKSFSCNIKDLRTESPLTLAYIGDAVYDLIVRTVVVERANRSPKELHKSAVKYVNAATQARMIEALEADLTEDETAVFHRGRNAKSGTSAKNASIVDYRKATGFEAVIGYLYLQGDMERAVFLIKKALEMIELEL